MTGNALFFKLLKPESFSWEVKVPIPDAGKYKYFSFTAKFRHLEGDALQKLFDDKLSDVEYSKAVVMELLDIKDEAGGLVPSSPELISSLLANERVPAATVSTYLAAMRGMAAEKN